MKTDIQLKNDVVAELAWEPGVNSTHVGVAVKDGVVTLIGHIDTYAEKAHIERAAQRVKGVKALAVELDVRLSPGHQRSDSEIAEAARNALRWNVMIPDENLKVKVEKGWVTLSGEVDWASQRDAASAAVGHLTGVMGVANAITLKSRALPGDIASRIREALRRHADREANAIEIVVSGSTVTLMGSVHSWDERMAVQGAAWAAPGVTSVVNRLSIGT